MARFDPIRLRRLDDRMRHHADAAAHRSIVWAVADADDVHAGATGAGIDRTAIFRIASMTKPIVSALALVLVEDATLRLDDPVDDLLPELADRRVLVDPGGPMDGSTVPASRPITLHDVLTFRLGWGMDFERPWPQPLLDAMGERGLGAGPPAPDGPPPPEEWIRRLGELPLLHQPGTRWLYHVGAEVLGVLLARAAGRPLDELLRDRLLEPLGMRDTGFWTRHTDRLVTSYGSAAGDVYDPPDGQWSRPPAFPSGGAGLVSTIDDLVAFARMLLGRGGDLLSPAAVETMTTDQLLPDQGGPLPDGSQGWGFGVSVQRRRTGLGRGVGSYGWDGGLGTSWANDPVRGTIGIVLTNEMFSGPFPAPAVVQDFWTGMGAAWVDTAP